jgi:hypothetical protein
MSGMQPMADPVTGSVARAALEGATPTAIALVTATLTVIASWSADSYQSRGGELELVKDDGTTIRRRVLIYHDGTSGGDATDAWIESHGAGSSADIAAGAIDADVSGTGTSQVVRLIITATANGSSWNATFYPDFLKTATP